LISSQRVDRLAEIEQTSTNTIYSPTELFADLRGGLFRELNANPVDIDLYRRNLQRSYVDMLSATLKNPARDSDFPAYARAELEAIRAMIDRTNASQIKPVARIHLKDLAARISRALDPRLPIEQ
jgi:hypothetical protein